MGAELSELPPLAVEVAKRAVDAVAESSRETGLLIERLAYGLLAQTTEHAEATTGFDERRERDP
jgi:enoyl-CoA hydratase/carnithine racemase